MAYPISPDYNDQVGYLLTRIPQYGVLYLNDQPLHVGERFSERDILSGAVRYQQTRNLPVGALSVQDGFDFRLFDRGLIVTSDSQYVSCLPDREIAVPTDGIYTFPITIRATPTPVGVARSFALKQSSSRAITNLDLNIAGAASEASQIIHTVVGKPREGAILLNSRPVTQFTQEDVNAGRISYAHSGGIRDDSIGLRSCNQFSKCVNNTLSVSFAPTVSFTGDNVFYGKIGTKWQAQLTATKPLLLWDLIGTTPVGPPLSPVAIGVVYWTYYDPNYTGAANVPERGAGYDKLPLYRNIPLRYQWGGGLPTGVYVDNMEGLVSTASRVPYDPDNDVTWVLPLVPDEFHWRVQITDPYTGESAVRDYTLRVTETGTGANGQTSETL